MTEIWIRIPEYEGFYEVSDRGQVRSVDRVDSRGHRRRGKTLSPGRANKQGHLSVALSLAGVQRTHYVHQLVLKAFVGPRPTGGEGCHANDDPTDNRLVNLRWDTRRANAADSVRNGNNPNASKTHCPASHEYTPGNTYQHPSGSRICRECRRAARKAA